MLHDRFVDAVHAFDAQAIRAALAPEVRFFSPVSFKPYEGRDLVGTIITEGPFTIFKDFEYVERLEDTDARVATLIFVAKVGDRAVDGLDLIHFDDDGLVAQLTVMLRPLSGVTAMAEAMGKKFEELGLA